MNTSSALLFFAVAFAWGDGLQAADNIQIDSVLVTLIEQVDVPAREAGVLADVMAREGDLVEAKATLAQIDDNEAKLRQEHAQIELENARKQAKNNISILFSKKSLDLAKAELKRAIDSRERYRKSITDSEIDRHQLAVQKAELEIKQAEFDLEIAQHTKEISENELQLAKHALERRKIRAPIAGIVVQVNRHRGEWVEPGDSVMRLLRIGSLRAEGFLNLNDMTSDLSGAKVKLQVLLPGQAKPVDFEGEIVFVSPEVNPVNGQIRVWAEIENRDLLLRPGMRASMTIQKNSAQTTNRPASPNQQVLRVGKQ